MLTRILTFLILLVLISSRPEIFDEYVRRQYVAKAPRRNPFGVEEEPAKFAEFDIFTKVCIFSYMGRRDNACFILTHETRFECYNSSRNGLWSILIVSEREWSSKKTMNRLSGYVNPLSIYMVRH